MAAAKRPNRKARRRKTGPPALAPDEGAAIGDGLSPRHRRFVLEYLVDLNATQAAVRAGYRALNADVVGPRLLGSVGIRAAVNAALKDRERRVAVAADDVLRELVRVALVDPARLIDLDGRLLPLSAMPEDVRRAVASIEVEEIFEGRGKDREHVGNLHKVKFWNKNEALRDLGKHLKLFTDVQELRHDFGPIEEAYERLKRDVESRGGSGTPPPDRS